MLLIDHNESQPRLRFKMVDSAGGGIVGKLYNDVDLTIEKLSPADTDWVDITGSLTTGTVGTYSAYKFVNISGDWYELDLPVAAVTSGKQTAIRITYGANNPQEGYISATGSGTETTVITVPQSTISTASLPSDTQELYRGTGWTITLEGVGDISADVTAIYFSVKTADTADDDALVRVRFPLNGAGGDSGLQRINGGAATLGDASVTHTTYVEGGNTLNRFVCKIKGEATALITPTLSITAGNRVGYTRSTETNGYHSEWKLVGTLITDEVLTQGRLRVRPDLTKLTA